MLTYETIPNEFFPVILDEVSTGLLYLQDNEQFVFDGTNLVFE